MKVRQMRKALQCSIVLLALGISGTAFGAPLRYEALYEITHAEVEDEWGPINVGDIAVIRFGWDVDRARRVDHADHPIWDPAPFVDYTLTIGDVVVSSAAPNSIYYIRWEDAHIGIGDSVPYACPLHEPDCYGNEPLLGNVFVDDLIVMFSCPQWADHPDLLPNLACGSELTGSFGLAGFLLPAYGDPTRVSGSLFSLRVVGVLEPSTFALFLSGMLLPVALRRRNTSQ